MLILPRSGLGVHPVRILLALIVSALPVVSVFAQNFTLLDDSPMHTVSNTLGVSWADYDMDGDPDLFCPVGNALNKVYRNNGNGTFSDTLLWPLVNADGFSTHGLWADLNGDGYLDLYVIGWSDSTRSLYLNDGPPGYNFTQSDTSILVRERFNAWTASSVDFDRDGDVDVFVGATHDHPSRLYVNQGNMLFTPLDFAGFATPDDRRSDLMGYWVDIDDDGDEDLYIIKYNNHANELYRNLLVETGSPDLEAITDSPLVAEIDNTAGASWGDVDNDGDDDLFVVTFESESSNLDQLWINDGEFQFHRAEGTVFDELETGGLGTAFGDVNNDGWLDLVVGIIVSDQLLYLNDGSGGFIRTTLPQHGSPSAATMVDFDRDGDLDLYYGMTTFVGNGIDYPFRNDTPDLGHFIEVTLHGVNDNAFADGAVARAKILLNGEPVWLKRHVWGSPTGDRGMAERCLHFGLGDANQVDTLEVRWPSGMVEIWTDIAADQFLELTQGGSSDAIEHSELEQPSGIEFTPAFPNPFNATTVVQYHLNERTAVRLAVYDIRGRFVRMIERGVQPPGLHRLAWDGADQSGTACASGIYLLTLTTPARRHVSRVALVR